MAFVGELRRQILRLEHFEDYLTPQGVVVLKFYLNLSREEQKKRFLERLEIKEKNWKFSAADVRERKYWDEYQDAYEKMIRQTATEYAPWVVVPADVTPASRVIPHVSHRGPLAAGS